jgi:hypothetical protein
MNSHVRVWWVSLICDAYYENCSGNTEIRKNAGNIKFTVSRGTECGIMRSNFSPFNLNTFWFGVPKRNDVTGERKKLLHNLYSSPGHVVRKGLGRKVYKVWWEGPKERDHAVYRWIYIVISRTNNFDISRSIKTDMDRYISIKIDISWSINIEISRSISTYIGRLISINLGLLMSTYLGRIISIYLNR